MSKVTKPSTPSPFTQKPPRPLRLNAPLVPTHTHTPNLPSTPDPRALLTESDLGQVQPVDPGDLAQRVGGDEDHHEADGAARPSVRE